MEKTDNKLQSYSSLSAVWQDNPDASHGTWLFVSCLTAVAKYWDSRLSYTTLYLQAPYTHAKLLFCQPLLVTPLFIPVALSWEL